MVALVKRGTVFGQITSQRLQARGHGRTCEVLKCIYLVVFTLCDDHHIMETSHPCNI